VSTLTETEKLIGRICAGIYIALTEALPEETAALAHQVMFDLAESPHLRPDDRKIYYLIAATPRFRWTSLKPKLRRPNSDSTLFRAATTPLNYEITIGYAVSGVVCFSKIVTMIARPDAQYGGADN
jgi:hypothetical protein